jgi:hypothetical protein
VEKVKVKLSKAIQAHGAEVTEIELRPPVGKDIRESGFPYSMDAQESLHFDSKSVAKYIEKLAGIPPSSVDAMSPADFQACLGVIMGFFGGAQGT